MIQFAGYLFSFITGLLLLLTNVSEIKTKYLDGREDYGNIKWLFLQKFEIKNEVASGIEFREKTPIFTYTVRVKLDGDYYCGKYNEKLKTVLITSEDGKEIGGNLADTEFLSYPKGTISWVYATSKDPLPENLWECGEGQGGERKTYPCRAVYKKQVILGRYAPSKKKCIISFEKVHEYDRFELPVINLLGKMTKAG